MARRGPRWRRSSAALFAAAGFAVLLGLGPADSVAGREAATMTVCQGAAYTTIQSAVDAASSGDTISVCAGTYTEQVVFPASLSNVTLSASSSPAVIGAPSPMTGEKAIVEVAGAKNIAVTGFTISGPGDGGCNSIRFGVEVDQGGSATISQNTITNIRDNPFSGCQNGWAIGGGVLSSLPSGSDSGSVTATGNTITGFQKAGMLLKGAGSVDTVTGNTITGAGPTGTINQNGIQVSAGASATVSANTISGDSYTSGGGSTGILLFSDLNGVTVSQNTLSGNDIGVSAFQAVPHGTVSISGNTITGGSRGISLTGTSGISVSQNTSTGAAQFGIAADSGSTGNTFTENSAAGVTGAGNFDCSDASTGTGTAGTGNTWTQNTGESASPAGICGTAPVTTITLSPATPDGPAGSYAGAVLVKVAATVASGTVTETRCVLDPATPPSSFADLPSRPCIYMGTGAVVLGAGNHTVFGASSSSGGLVEAPVQKSFSIAAVPTPTPPPSPGSPPLSGVDVPPVVVVPPGPTVPATPPANTPPVVTGKQPPPVRKKPTAVQKANQVVARMKKQHLSACAVGIFTAGQQHQLLARGLALAPTKGTSRLVVTVDLVPVGKKRLERSFGGVPAVVTTTCVTTKNGKVSGVKKTRIVLEIEHTVTTPGTFVPDSPQLTQEGAQLIGALRQKIIQPLLLRCDGYTADFAPSPVDAQALSVARATAVCLALKQPTLVHPPVVVGHGDTHPIASNTTEAGRAQNRRVAITLYHRITPER